MAPKWLAPVALISVLLVAVLSVSGSRLPTASPTPVVTWVLMPLLLRSN